MRRIRQHAYWFAAPFLVAAMLAQPPEPITDPDAYAIYATLLTEGWPDKGQPILLQQVTTIARAGRVTVPENDAAEWQAATHSFFRENATTRLLQPLLRSDVAYRLISKADIDADDARLARKYPGMWQRLPESMEYAAVSVVGFNAAKNKAIAYVRFRSSGGLHYMEKRDGLWVRATLPGFGIVGWIASRDSSVNPQPITDPLPCVVVARHSSPRWYSGGEAVAFDTLGDWCPEKRLSTR